MSCLKWIFPIFFVGTVMCEYGMTYNEYEYANIQTIKLFKFENCGPADDTFKVNSLDLRPNPLKLPGTITVGVECTLGQNVTGPLSVKLKLMKKVGPMKLELPCIDGFGSCTYENICALLPPNNNGCSDFFKQNSIPCSCPFPHGDYSAQNLQIDVNIPVKPPGGDYEAIANLMNHELGHVACLNIDFSIQH